jgi:hypothetical protein
MLKKTTFLGVICLIISHLVEGQSGWQTLALDNLNSFKPQAGNWMIVGDVMMNRNIDIHQKPTPNNPTPVVNDKKKKKNQNTIATPPPEVEKPVIYQAGQGILLNYNTDTQKDNLVSVLEHGDIELELEVMLPKGSNSGLYLQGAYEVQLFDSWGVENPSFSDIGGIYRNWENSPDKAYAGKSPLLNAAKAPGLWQTMKISFQAPRFNAQGEKTANARFLLVELNGVKIHENVEVPQMTGGSILKSEAPKGPLMIQGDHGPVAFRKVRYRLLKESEAKLTDISYQVFHGRYETENDFAKLKPAFAGTSENFTWEVAKKDNDFAIRYKATLHIPEDGTYSFVRQTNNSFKMSLNDKVLIDYGAYKSEGVVLTQGKYPLEIVYFKRENWLSPNLGLMILNDAAYPKALQSFGSFPPAQGMASPIYVEVGSKPKLLRAFLDFKNDYKLRLTHTIAVGHPSGTHYIYDLKSGRLVCGWRGNFLDATPMWNDRGDGSFRPRGLVQYLSRNQALAILTDSLGVFPMEYQENDFKSKGYILDNQGNPTFKYNYKDIAATDKINILDGNKGLSHTISLEGDVSKAYYKLAEGKSIQLLKDGSYSIDDNQYYIEVKSANKPFVRTMNGQQELVVKCSNSLIYSALW